MYYTEPTRYYNRLYKRTVTGRATVSSSSLRICVISRALLGYFPVPCRRKLLDAPARIGLFRLLYLISRHSSFWSPRLSRTSYATKSFKESNSTLRSTDPAGELEVNSALIGLVDGQILTLCLSNTAHTRHKRALSGSRKVDKQLYIRPFARLLLLSVVRSRERPCFYSLSNTSRISGPPCWSCSAGRQPSLRRDLF